MFFRLLSFVLNGASWWKFENVCNLIDDVNVPLEFIKSQPLWGKEWRSISWPLVGFILYRLFFILRLVWCSSLIFFSCFVLFSLSSLSLSPSFIPLLLFLSCSSLLFLIFQHIKHLGRKVHLEGYFFLVQLFLACLFLVIL